MKHILHNPVYNALLTADKSFNQGKGEVKYFDAEVSPFVGFNEDNKNGFSQLHEQLPEGRSILYAKPEKIDIPGGWQLIQHIGGLQFIYEGGAINSEFENVKPLSTEHIEEMIALVRLTKPGPFGKRTIEFGSYHGIFDNEKLVAMTGQRLHVENYTELSAVCTHPDHLGKGYAGTLMQHQLQIILDKGEKPFLHSRDDNERAIALYERLGFKVSRPMNFYFMKRK